MIGWSRVVGNVTRRAAAATYQQGRIDEFMAQNALDDSDLAGVIAQVHELAEPKLDA